MTLEEYVSAVVRANMMEGVPDFIAEIVSSALRADGYRVVKLEVAVDRRRENAKWGDYIVTEELT